MNDDSSSQTYEVRDKAREAGIGGEMMTIAPGLRGSALVARSCPPGTFSMKPEYPTTALVAMMMMT